MLKIEVNYKCAICYDKELLYIPPSSSSVWTPMILLPNQCRIVGSAKDVNKCAMTCYAQY